MFCRIGSGDWIPISEPLATFRDRSIPPSMSASKAENVFHFGCLDDALGLKPPLPLADPACTCHEDHSHPGRYHRTIETFYPQDYNHRNICFQKNQKFFKTCQENFDNLSFFCTECSRRTYSIFSIVCKVLSFIS